MDQYLQEAFDAVCKEAKPAQGFYVSLMENMPYYGGSEEGGWWGTDRVLIAYQYFSTEEEAELASAKVKELAKELTAESRKDFGEQCLRQTKWLDDRGLDDNFLPEPDGQSEFDVIVSEGLPEEHFGCRHYE